MKNRVDKLFSKQNRLSDISSNKGIQFLNSALSPGSHCPMHTTLAFVRNVQGISTLVVGMGECGYYSRYVMGESKGSQGELHYTYMLDENEVVFGCREGLIKALFEMEQDGANIILVIMTCIPELIGEDMEAIIYEIKDQMKAELLTVSVPHFKYNGYQSGYVNTILELIKLMKPVETSQKQVNILGSNRGEDLEIILNDIKSQYKINNLGNSITIKEIEEAPGATINIVVSKYAIKLAQEMEKEFSIPYVSLYMAYDTEEINESYQLIYEKLNMNSTNKIENKLKEYQEAIVSLETELLKSRKSALYCMTDITIDPLPVALYLEKLGLKPELMHIEEFYDTDMRFLERLVQKDCNPYVCYLTDQSDLTDYLEEIQSKLSLGKWDALCKCRGGIDSDLRQLSNIVGYERTRKLLVLIKSLFEQINKGEV